MLFIDLVGHFTCTEQGNSVILVLNDHFGRLRNAIVLPNCLAEVVTAVLEHRVLCYLGSQEPIHLDQWIRLYSHLFKQLYEFWEL